MTFEIWAEHGIFLCVIFFLFSTGHPPIFAMTPSVCIFAARLRLVSNGPYFIRSTIYKQTKTVVVAADSTVKDEAAPKIDLNGNVCTSHALRCARAETEVVVVFC